MSKEKILFIIKDINNKNFDSAKEKLENLIKLNPQNHSYLNLLSIVLVNQKKYLQAISILKMGGNAIDAAIAASDAVTPVAPQSAPAADLHRAADDFQFGGAGTPSQMELVRLRVRNEALEAENSLLREQLGEAQADKRELFKLVGNDRFRARGWWASVFGKD